MEVLDLNRRQSMENRITVLAEQLAASMGMDIVLVEIKGDGNHSVVRAFIDKPDGIRWMIVSDSVNAFPFHWMWRTGYHSATFWKYHHLV